MGWTLPGVGDADYHVKKKRRHGEKNERNTYEGAAGLGRPGMAGGGAGRLPGFGGGLVCVGGMARRFPPGDVGASVGCKRSSVS